MKISDTKLFIHLQAAQVLDGAIEGVLVFLFPVQKIIELILPMLGGYVALIIQTKEEKIPPII